MYIYNLKKKSKHKYEFRANMHFTVADVLKNENTECHNKCTNVMCVRTFTKCVANNGTFGIF